MRTNTKTFAKRIFRDLRAEGLSSVKAKAARGAILYAASQFGFPDLSDTARARVSMDSVEVQTVYIDDEGIARFVCELAPAHQPLISTEPTAEQTALSNEMVDMLCDLYAAEGEEKERVKGLYNSKRDMVLAINPFVHANVADPDGMEFYHNIHKSEYGFRPRGFLTYAMMREKIEMILRNAENVEVKEAA